MKKLFAAIFSIFLGITSANAGSSTISVSTTFTPLHQYYMAPNGNDNCDGTSTTIGTSGSCAWASPNHSVVCGDIILANSGTYNSNNFQTWGSVSGCGTTGSSSGGIDGNGGIFFAVVLCATGSVGDCKITDTNNPNSASMNVGRNHWCVQGWYVNTNTSSGTQQVAFQADGTTGAQDGPITHHMCFVNNISSNSGMGFITADGGTNNGVSPGNGVDQWAVVGNISRDSNSSTICIGSIDDAGPANNDSSTGTHVYVKGNFVINNQQKWSGCTGDGEGIFFDTWDAHGYTGQGVIEDNLVWKAERFGIAVFYQHSVTTSVLAPMRVVYNTVYSVLNENDNGPCCTSFGQMNFHSATANNWPFATTIQNNVSLNSSRLSTQGNSLYALQIDTSLPNGQFTIGGTGNENLFKSLATSCGLVTCDSGNNVTSAASSFSFGINFYEDPTFNNSSDAMTNWIGDPNCAGHETTVSCMGWNYATQTATTNTPIYDFIATSAHSGGKGYKPPGLGCESSGERYNNFPTYMKGMIYLHAVNGWTNGTPIVQKAGLVNMRCNM